MKYIQIEVKNDLQGHDNRVDEAKNNINDQRHKEAKNNQLEQQEKRIQKNEDSISSLWDNFKRFNIRIMGGRQKKKSTRNWKSI